MITETERPRRPKRGWVRFFCMPLSSSANRLNITLKQLDVNSTVIKCSRTFERKPRQRYRGIPYASKVMGLRAVIVLARDAAVTAGYPPKVGGAVVLSLQSLSSAGSAPLPLASACVQEWDGVSLLVSRIPLDDIFGI